MGRYPCLANAQVPALDVSYSYTAGGCRQPLSDMIELICHALDAYLENGSVKYMTSHIDLTQIYVDYKIPSIGDKNAKISCHLKNTAFSFAPFWLGKFPSYTKYVQ